MSKGQGTLPTNIFVSKNVSKKQGHFNANRYYSMNDWLVTALTRMGVLTSNCCAPTSLAISTLSANYQIGFGYNIVSTVDPTKVYGVVLPHANTGLSAYRIKNSDTNNVSVIGSTNVGTAGTGYTSIPVVTITPVSGGANAVLTANMKLLTSSLASAGLGYVTADVSTTGNLIGGVSTTVGQITISTLKLVSATVVSGGTSGYLVGDTFTLTGGTGTSPTLTVATVSSGQVTSFTISGTNTYTVTPTLTPNTLTAGTVHGTGSVTANLSMGINTYTISTAGVYQTLPTSTMSVDGNTGTGAVITPLTWGVTTLTIQNAGNGYLVAPTLGFTGGGGSSAAATATITPIPSSLLVYTQTGEYMNGVQNGIAYIPSGKTGIFLVSSLNNWVTFSIS